MLLEFHAWGAAAMHAVLRVLSSQHGLRCALCDVQRSITDVIMCLCSHDAARAVAAQRCAPGCSIVPPLAQLALASAMSSDSAPPLQPQLDPLTSPAHLQCIL